MDGKEVVHLLQTLSSLKFSPPSLVACCRILLNQLHEERCVECLSKYLLAPPLLKELGDRNIENVLLDFRSNLKDYSECYINILAILQNTSLSLSPWILKQWEKGLLNIVTNVCRINDSTSYGVGVAFEVLKMICSLEDIQRSSLICPSTILPMIRHIKELLNNGAMEGQWLKSTGDNRYDSSGLYVITISKDYEKMSYLFVTGQGKTSSVSEFIQHLLQFMFMKIYM